MPVYSTEIDSAFGISSLLVISVYLAWSLSIFSQVMSLWVKTGSTRRTRTRLSRTRTPGQLLRLCRLHRKCYITWAYQYNCKTDNKHNLKRAIQSTRIVLKSTSFQSSIIIIIIIIIITRRMYWRRPSIQDGQAFTMVMPLFWNGFSRDNFIIFHRRSKRIAFLESVKFFYVCLHVYANFQFSWWSRDHFSAPFRGLYLPNDWSQTLQTSKRHTFGASAFRRYHWFGIKLSCLCRLVEWYPKTLKMLFLDLIPRTLQNSGIFHGSTRPHLHFDGLPPKSRRSVISMYRT